MIHFICTRSPSCQESTSCFIEFPALNSNSIDINKISVISIIIRKKINIKFIEQTLKICIFFSFPLPLPLPLICTGKIELFKLKDQKMKANNHADSIIINITIKLNSIFIAFYFRNIQFNIRNYKNG